MSMIFARRYDSDIYPAADDEYDNQGYVKARS
jgi:hypothetical protein